MRWLSLMLAIAGALSLTGAAQSAVPEPLVRFSRLPVGWEATATYALSWNYQLDARGWAGSMPRNAIALTVHFPRTKTASYPPLRLMLPARPTTKLEGAPDTPEYRVKGRIHGRDVEIWIAIRRPVPTAAQLRQAQQVLAGITFIANR